MYSLDINKISKTSINYHILQFQDMQQLMEQNSILQIIVRFQHLILEQIIETIYYYQVLESDLTKELLIKIMILCFMDLLLIVSYQVELM